MFAKSSLSLTIVIRYCHSQLRTKTCYEETFNRVFENESTLAMNSTMTFVFCQKLVHTAVTLEIDRDFHVLSNAAAYSY